jgi:hypothetical protein
MSVEWDDAVFDTPCDGGLPKGVVSRIVVPDTVRAVVHEDEDTEIEVFEGDFIDYYADGRKLFNGKHPLKAILR